MKRKKNKIGDGNGLAGDYFYFLRKRNNREKKICDRIRELEKAAKGRAEMTVSKETTLLKDKTE